MKNRVLTLLLTLLFMCSLCTGCGSSASAHSVIQSAMEKTQALDSMAAEMKMEMTMSANGMTLSMPITVNIKAKDIKSDDPVVFTKLSLTMLGQSLDAEMYQENEWSYVVMGDTKYKTQAENRVDEYDYSDEILQDIPEVLLENVEMVKGEDGSATATISIPGEQFTQIYEELIETLNESVSEEAEVVISDAVVKITVANGYISVYDMAFNMEVTVDDTSSTMDVKASVSYENPGQDVEITPPEGYQDFEEISSAS